MGYAYRAPAEAFSTVVKQRTPASRMLERISVPDSVSQLLVHVRDYTKGHPSIPANNHPVRHGPVVGIHNGIILNDDELLSGHDCARMEERMTVDSEAIFALAAHSRNRACALEELHGSMAAAWFDEREPDVLFAARGVGRPMWAGRGKSEIFFASTRTALEVVERYAGVKLRKQEVGEGSLLRFHEGTLLRRDGFSPDTSFVEEDDLPPVRAPQEAVSCLRRLRALAA